MKFYPIENDGVRFLLPESSVSMVASYDSRGDFAEDRVSSR